MRAGPPAWTTTPTPPTGPPSPLPVQRSPEDFGLSDTALLALCRTGDGEAWHALVGPMRARCLEQLRALIEAEGQP